MKSRVCVRHIRRILCVFPRYAPSFGTFQHSYELTDGVRAFMPPQGILVVASYLPESWEVRLVDENIRPAAPEEFAWADAVFVSGMHVQKQEILGIARRARDAGKPSVLGGPSVSACPEEYEEFDYLHIGEIGDATDALIAALDENVSPPLAQRRFVTAERLPLADFPIPAYHLIEGRRYFLGSVQFSSGCPYRCEFCDIPALYGRQPRLKTPEQILAELDAMLDAGIAGAVYFVDDNFIGNKKAARELLPLSDRLAEAARVSDRVFLRGDAQHRAMPRHSRNDARGMLLHGVLRHRNARAGRARRHAQVAQSGHAAARRGGDDQ